MKIKYFSGEVDVKNSEELGDYLINDLGYANDPVVQAYADLLFKIHEKISMYESLLNNDSISELDKIKANTRIVVLKSLLEGEPI